LPTRLYRRKAEELGERLEALARAVPRGTPPPELAVGDARRLSHLPDASVDVVLTSPPYLGTYDYAEQHLRRFGWLGLDARRFAEVEIGSRRRASSPAAALAAWQRDVDAFIGEIARVLRPWGVAYVVIGDSAVGTEVIEGDAALRGATERTSLVVRAWAFQTRPSFYPGVARAQRREHLLLLAHR
jgi:DNA modification methylase